jgi:hypothetical protein
MCSPSPPHSLPPCRPGDRPDIQRLAGQVLHAGQRDGRDARAVAIDALEHVFGPQQVLAGSRCDLNEIACRIGP